MAAPHQPSSPGAAARDQVELPLHLGHLEGEVDGEGSGLAVPGAAADDDAALHGHADLGEQRGLGPGEAEALQRHVFVQPVAVEEPGEEMVGVGVVRPALAAERRDVARQRHRAAGADGETLEGGAAVAGLRRSLVLAVEEEAHDPAAFLGGQWARAERQLAVG